MGRGLTSRDCMRLIWPAVWSSLAGQVSLRPPSRARATRPTGGWVRVVRGNITKRSGGSRVLLDVVDRNGPPPRLGVAAGKAANLSLADRDNMGKFNPANNNNIYQVVSGALGGPVFSMPAYFNSVVYYGAVGDTMKAFPIANARLAGAPSSQTANRFPFPGTTPSVSANSSSNGIVLSVENGNVAVLHAFDASNLGSELYNSNQAANGRDHFGVGNKFITP